MPQTTRRTTTISNGTDLDVLDNIQVNYANSIVTIEPTSKFIHDEQDLKTRLDGIDSTIISINATATATNATVTSLVSRTEVLEDGGFAGDNRWRDFLVPASSFGAGASAPDPITIIGNLRGYGFDGGVTTEQMYTEIEINHDAKIGVAGAVLRPHVHYAPSTGTVGTVLWQMEYAHMPANGTISAVTTATALSTTSGVTWSHAIVSFPTISAENYNIGDYMVIRLFRNPTADTYPNDALFLGLGVHYQVDSNGSQQEYVKT